MARSFARTGGAVPDQLAWRAKESATPGLVPYFVSGPLSNNNWVGVLGALLHVAAWVIAIIFDFAALNSIDTYDHAPAAHTYLSWGLVAFLLAFGLLLLVTVLHALPTTYFTIPEGGAPPFLMTAFKSGVSISLVFTLIVAIVTSDSAHDDALMYNVTDLGAQGVADKRASFRNYLVFAIISKLFTLGFLRNNQEWAGPAEAMKKQAAGGDEAAAPLSAA